MIIDTLKIGVSELNSVSVYVGSCAREVLKHLDYVVVEKNVEMPLAKFFQFEFILLQLDLVVRTVHDM